MFFVIYIYFFWMRVSVVFATRANEQSFPHLERILWALNQQIFQDFKVLIVCDKKFSEKEYSDFLSFIQGLSLDVLEKTEIFTHLNADFNEHHTWGASYVRNYGLKKVDTELVQLFDDDNGFDEWYLQRAVEYYDDFRRQQQTEIVITPTLMYRDTSHIQNQGFSSFCYWQSRPVLHLLKSDEKYGNIQMFSWNGLLGNTKFFQSVLYDEDIAWIAEDLDFTLSLHEQEVKLFSFVDLIVRHYERDKKRLEESWIGSQKQAHQKARNRFLFVYKHGTTCDKTVFWCIGLPGCLVWLSLKALRLGKKDSFWIIKGLFQGCREGWKVVKEKSRERK